MHFLQSYLKSPVRLESSCYVKYSANLLHQKKIRDIIQSLFTESFLVQECRWPRIQLDLSIWIEGNLVMPFLLKDKLINMLKLLAIEINIYLEGHSHFFGNLSFTNDSINNICFTSYGIVDKLKTAKKFVKDENFDLVNRFKLACTYCLEEEIFSLWQNGSEFWQEYYDIRPIEFWHNTLVKFWTVILSEQLDSFAVHLSANYGRDCCLYKIPFKVATICANEVALMYYGKQLNVKHQENLFLQAAIDVVNYRCLSKQIYFPSEYSKVLMHLFSVLNAEKIFEVIKRKCYGVLICLLDYPWQHLFLKALDYSWPYLSKKEYVSLLNIIVNDRLVAGSTDFDYVTLFRCFWKKSPKSLKEFVIRPSSESEGFQVMLNLFALKDWESISLILNDATIDERIAIVHYEVYWYPLLRVNQMMLKYILKKCLTSDNVYKKCRRKIVKKISIFKRKGVHYAERQQRWEQFLKYVDKICYGLRSTKKFK